jgi:hypothetical protein
MYRSLSVTGNSEVRGTKDGRHPVAGPDCQNAQPFQHLALQVSRRNTERPELQHSDPSDCALDQRPLRICRSGGQMTST